MNLNLASDKVMITLKISVSKYVIHVLGFFATVYARELTAIWICMQSTYDCTN